MKICFITTGDIKNIATSKRALGMANPLSKLNWDVHIIIEDAEENVFRTKMECCHDIKIHFFKKSSFVNEIKYKNSIIKKIKPDYIYICAFVPRNFIFRIPGSKVLIEHSELQSSIPDTRGLKKIFSFSYELFSLVYSDALICASKYLEKYFQKSLFFKFNKIPIFYHPYAFSSRVNKNIELDQLKSHISSFTDRFNFTFLGTITNNYGSSLMLNACKLLVDRELTFRLLLLGKGRHYEEAKKFVKDNNLVDYIYLPGYVDEDDISQYFSITDSFLSPMNNTIQDWARCPSKLYMYLPYKKPIITCKIGEPHIVLNDNGVYYESGSSSSLANAMENILLSKSKYFTDPTIHSWDFRTKEFDQWIKINFN